MKTLYFDCFAGASGNMILGGLIALGVDPDELIAKLKTLPVADFSIEVSKVDRSGVSSTHVQVNVPPESKHRHLRDIEKIIDESQLSAAVRDRAAAIFRRLARAEAQVHGIEIDQVHFHEVGALDAIVDVVGACIGFEILGIERFACSKIHLGSGFVKMQHGTYPIPPPAVANLLEGIPVYSTEIEGELITPTGAAVISTLCETYGRMPEMIIEQTGYGAGTRKYDDFPNTIRLILGIESTVEDHEGHHALTSDDLISERLVLLETNVDDISAQVVGYVMERAFERGALDCWVTSIQMKKNRPAGLISVLCSKRDQEDLTKMLFTETTTLGVRSAHIERSSLPREIRSVETRFGRIEVKVAKYGGKVVNIMPEYEQVRAAAITHDVPFRQVHAETIANFKGKALSAIS